MLSAREIQVDLRGRPVLNQVSARITGGLITGLAGANGAGKSTLLRALAGLLPLRAGAIELDGRALPSFPRRELAQRIAYLPQDRTVHWPLLSRAVVALGRLPHRGARERETPADRRAIDTAMAVMDVADLADRPVTELSGGERARVLVARTLAQECRIILADEPAAGLDPGHALQLFRSFERLAAQGYAVVIALHDLSSALRFCHHAILLGQGKVVASGPAAEVLKPEILSSAFGVRFALGVMEGIPHVLALEPENGGPSIQG